MDLSEHCKVRRLITPRDWQASALAKAADGSLDGYEASEKLVESKRYEILANEIDYLRAWIRNEGEANGTCTKDILNEVCRDCQCDNKPKAKEVTTNSIATEICTQCAMDMSPLKVRKTNGTLMTKWYCECGWTKEVE